MAYPEYDRYGIDMSAEAGDASVRPVRFGRLVNAAGAMTSVALICGLAVWGYKLAVRDVTGVPVIRAIAGPARTAPDDPGGELAQHTGLAVNAVTAFGTAEPAAEELRLAPAPTALSDEDLPMGEFGTVAQGEAPPAGDLGSDDSRLLPAAALANRPLPEPLPDDPADPILEAPVVASIDAAVAMAIMSDAGDDATSYAAADAAPAAEISGPGPIRSPHPPVRPDTIAGESLVDDPAEPVQLARFSDVDPESLAPGTRLVQLGAFESEAEARSEWDRLALGFGPLMAGKGRVIEQAESGGAVFYRLRVAGFDDLDAARRFCAALVDQEVHCIPVQVR